VGNRGTKTVHSNGALQKHFGYGTNGRNQMTSWSEWNGSGVLQRSATLTYDVAGNRITQSITPAGGSAQLTTYAWDYDNRLTSVTLPGSVTHSYGYDYRMRRITRSEPGENPVAMTYSGGLSVAEYEVIDPLLGTLGASPEVEYQRGPDMGGGVGGLLYSLRSGTAKFNLSNGRGDVVAQSDSNGDITWTASYEAYGKRPVETGSNVDRQRANTKEEDPTGLLNEGFRYRDLETGTWLSRDPAGFVDGPNLYAYVRQNPWTSWDPLGLELDGYADGVAYAQMSPEGQKVFMHARWEGFVAGAKATAVFLWNLVPGIGEYNDQDESENPNNTPEQQAAYKASSLLGMATGGLSPNRSGVQRALRVIADAEEASALRGTREAAKELTDSSRISSVVIEEGKGAAAVSGRSIAADNYRGRYNAERHSKGSSRLPDDYDAHHRIPQEYMEHPDFHKFDFHAPDNIQGVKGSRADVNTHQDITNDWAKFREDNPKATGAEVRDFASKIDDKYKDHWFK
jgi:RHS repeat-associated protein